MEQWLHDCSVVSEGNSPVVTGELASWPSCPFMVSEKDPTTLVAMPGLDRKMKIYFGKCEQKNKMHGTEFCYI